MAGSPPVAKEARFLTRGLGCSGVGSTPTGGADRDFWPIFGLAHGRHRAAPVLRTNRFVRRRDSGEDAPLSSARAIGVWLNLVRALAWGARDCWFKSSHPD